MSKKREIQGRSMRFESGTKQKLKEGKQLKLELFSYKRFSEISRVRILHG